MYAAAAIMKGTVSMQRRTKSVGYFPTSAREQACPSPAKDFSAWWAAWMKTIIAQPRT
jgi:hypothetical protein